VSPAALAGPVGAHEPLALTVNGRAETVLAAGGQTLLDVLRRELGLFGAREGCGVGMCGACTVLLDGRPVSACLLPAALATEREVTTVEGLAGSDARLHPVQQAFVERNAFQCSFCTPGFVLATVGMLEEQADVSDREVREYLSGNLCRCGCYREIVEAALAARDVLRRSNDGNAKGEDVDS
jgi:carbon-monoxide dehydrogenase small subunit/isoquinoline 1-oxidoreductase alpha subunit/xanthine dehydrogenase YagT iron-sulfur-binding subunit